MLRYSDASASDATDALQDLDASAEDSWVEPEEADSEAGDGQQEPADAPDDVDMRTCDKCKDLSLTRPMCPHTTQDPPPQGKALMWAMRSIRLGASPTSDINEWTPMGFDLDCTDTQADGQPASCKPIDPTVLIAGDGEFGRDNSLGRNLAGGLRILGIQKLLPDMQTESAQRLQDGFYGIVLMLTDYGGGDQDPVVTLSAFLSVGTVGANGAHVAPIWDGNDSWAIDSSSLGSGSAPLYVDPNALVVDGRVVAHFTGTFPLMLQASKATMMLPIQGSTWTLELSTDHSTIVQGTLAGVIAAPAAAKALDDLGAQVGLCPGGKQAFDEIRKGIQRSADIHLDLSVDAQVLCDGMSAGVQFTAQAAHLGEIKIPAPVIVPSCDKDGGADGD